MDFNFSEEYKSYSNFELLKILKQPADYQPAAVDAATLILKEREVSEQENTQVNNHLEQIAQQRQLKKEKIDSLKQRFTGFLESYIRPDAEVRPAKWLDLLLVLMAVQYAWLLWDLFEWLMIARRFGTFFFFDPLLLLKVFHAIYIPIVFFLLLERKRWGWIIIFADYLLTVIIQLSMMLTRLEDIGKVSILHIFSVVLRCAMIYFLWRKDICNLFKISDKTKQYTVVFIVVGSPFLMALLYILFDL